MGRLREFDRAPGERVLVGVAGSSAAFTRPQRLPIGVAKAVCGDG